MPFDFQKSLIKVQGNKTYLPVAARVVWFREQCPDWGIDTEIVEYNHEKQYAVFRARIYNNEGKLIATGTKKEDVRGFPDYGEKAETGSIGRALALCGFGTQFSPDLDEGTDRLIDSPQLSKESKTSKATRKKNPEPETVVDGYWGDHPVTGEMVFFEQNPDSTFTILGEDGEKHPDQTQPDLEIPEVEDDKFA